MPIDQAISRIGKILLHFGALFKCAILNFHCFLRLYVFDAIDALKVEFIIGNRCLRKRQGIKKTKSCQISNAFLAEVFDVDYQHQT
jgi:hypothetical protein